LGEAPESPKGQPDYASTKGNHGQSSRDKEAGFRSVDAERQPRFRFNRFADDSNATRSTFTRASSDRLPLSIPYTTPASEFLYGTSVVEAALRSHRSPRRKLYKLYVSTGENREHAERDAGIERLARKSGVEVVNADTSWLRLLDKMSGGRPHNGYILEASPLPRLPITSLGEIIAQDGKQGFLVSLDHQSREEAAINGTSNFIALPRDATAQRSGKPFVLLLDSILDPGNLGGIIRTASFLGATAIAISSRNSASFSPVVLKASAGASENITLFSVNKPAGFVVDSKAAGWKVYAAVAPSKNSSSTTASITTSELDNPLVHDPCILMLGSEGEGLRWNLRSKADVELAIQGSGYSGSVDSLNVSVAAGILCHSFLKGEGASTPKRRETSPVMDDSTLNPRGDLF
jgi:21S rRNA (GM2251-2'-O)-methyltransferase